MPPHALPRLGAPSFSSSVSSLSLSWESTELSPPPVFEPASASTLALLLVDSAESAEGAPWNGKSSSRFDGGRGCVERAAVPTSYMSPYVQPVLSKPGPFSFSSSFSSFPSSSLSLSRTRTIVSVTDSTPGLVSPGGAGACLLGDGAAGSPSPEWPGALVNVSALPRPAEATLSSELVAPLDVESNNEGNRGSRSRECVGAKGDSSAPRNGNGSGEAVLSANDPSPSWFEITHAVVFGRSFPSPSWEGWPPGLGSSCVSITSSSSSPPSHSSSPSPSPSPSPSSTACATFSELPGRSP
mmetsp:Transcript_50059/g.150636  ORF Transcript_50059/g.150636 Transcript_50059/m.150636 type:complete len:298 (+) Transcript_50059:1753-2646(+)